MTKIPPLTKTSAQLAADFAEAFKGVKSPGETAVASLADQLKPYRGQINKLRQRGLTWHQISTGLKHPRIGLEISAKRLRDVFSAKKLAEPVTASVAGAPAAAAQSVPAAKPAPVILSAAEADERARRANHLVLDPLTLKPIPQV